ncbi:hypothetical protein WAP97_005220, partial [Escherichia coli]
KLNGVAGPAFQVIKDSLTLGLNALTLTDVTKNAAYGVDRKSDAGDKCTGSIIKKQPVLTFVGEVLAKKDSWVSHDTYIWQYIF